MLYKKIVTYTKETKSMSFHLFIIYGRRYNDDKKDYLYFEEASQLFRKLEANKPQLASIQDERDPRHIYELISY